MMAQLNKRCRRIARFCVQGIPIAVAKLFGQQLERLCMADNVASGGQ